jgi:uncharacterized protein YndB with AHSA1/START domain
MYSIKHLFHIAKPRQQVYEALATLQGLAAWWTSDTAGSSVAGGTIEFRFAHMGTFKMKVIALENAKEVTWEVLEGPPHWIGQTISFRLDENEGKTRVRFSHDGWPAQDDNLAIANFTWGRYLVSLRKYCETTVGEPFSVPQQ